MIIVVRACWLIFAVVWLLAAISTKRTIYRESSVSRLHYMLPLILAWVLLTRASRMIYPLNVQIIPQTDAVALIAAILCVAGLAFCLWARVTLGRNWSGTVTLKEDHELVIRGPYALVRHPIYTGLLAMFAATALMFGHVGGILGTVVVFFSFWLKLSEEEKLMIRQFPDDYPAYQRSVKKIIPFLI